MANFITDDKPPAWYDLENYHGVSAFRAVDWLACLRARKILWNAFDFLECAGLSISDVRKLMPDLILELDELRRNPLVPGDCDGWKNIVSRLNDEQIFRPVVRELTLQDLLIQRQRDFQGVEAGMRPEGKRSRWQQFETPPKMFPINEASVESFGTFNDGYVAILVDTQAPTGVIDAEFHRWLNNFRKEPISKATIEAKPDPDVDAAQGRNARKKKVVEQKYRERPAYQNWGRYGLLPYLDLSLWCRESGIKLTLQEMAAAVGNAKGGDTFRKTVPALAAKLMDSLSALEAQVSHETKNTSPPYQMVT
jgi:hypothetical protein